MIKSASFYIVSSIITVAILSSLIQNNTKNKTTKIVTITNELPTLQSEQYCGRINAVCLFIVNDLGKIEYGGTACNALEKICTKIDKQPNY